MPIVSMPTRTQGEIGKTKKLRLYVICECWVVYVQLVDGVEYYICLNKIRVRNERLPTSHAPFGHTNASKGGLAWEDAQDVTKVTKFRGGHDTG